MSDNKPASPPLPQEPVAWRWRLNGWPDLWQLEDVDPRTIDRPSRNHIAEVQPLYLAPPPAEPGGLETTDAMVDAALAAWFADMEHGESDRALEASMRRALGAALRLFFAPPPVEPGGLDEWIEREFAGWGTAGIHGPGYPYMPMDEAKTLTRRAVAAFPAPKPTAELMRQIKVIDDLPAPVLRDLLKKAVAENASLLSAPSSAEGERLSKLPTAFRVLANGTLFDNEEDAQAEAEHLNSEYRGLYERGDE